MPKVILALLFVAVSFNVHSEQNNSTLRFNQNAYGTGVHSDQYGRAYQTEPNIRLQQNTYGPGQHSDQYGKPVKVNPYGTTNGGKSWTH